MSKKRISDLTAASTPSGTEIFEISQLSATVTITAATLSAAASDNSYNDSANGFITAGFAVADRVNVSGFTGSGANNIFVGIVTALTAGKMTIGGTDGDVIVDDAAGESVTITKWVSRRITMNELRHVPMPSRAQAGASYTAVLADKNVLIGFTHGSAVAFTIPPAATASFPVDTVIGIEQRGAGVVTITAGAGVTLNSRGGFVATAGQYAVAQVKYKGGDVWLIIGDVA